MKKPFAVLLAIALTICSSIQAAPPSDESINQLLELSRAEKLMDSVWAQMDGIMKSSMQQVAKGKPLSADEQAIMDKQQTKMIAIMKDELSWDNLKDGMIQVYRETFTQEEIDGIIAFYKSPAGQALIDKQPALMKNTMALMQQRMGPMMQKIQAMTEETARELRAAKANEAGTPATK
jgi:hypothetical protein